MEEFKLLQRLEDFEAWVMPRLDSFPRAEKWALCTQIKNCVYRLMRQAIRIQKSRDKLRQIFEFDVDLEMLRIRFGMLTIPPRSMFLTTNTGQT